MTGRNHNLRSGGEALRAGGLNLAVHYALSIHAALYLIPLLPRTLWRLVSALRPGGAGVRDDDMLAIGRRDVGFRPWYAKIAADQRRYGRLGYAWDDGFGLPISTRFYNNALTYWLYGTLGVRRYLVLSLVLFLAVTLALAAGSAGWLFALALVILIAASPLFIAAQLHLGKPEILWWAVLPPLLLAALHGEWLIVGLLFSVVAFGNFAVAFLVGIQLVLLVALLWPGWAALVMLVAGMAPGVAKTALRLTPFLRSRLLGGLVGEQSDAAGGASIAARLRSLMSAVYIYYGGIFALSYALVMPQPLDWRFAAVGAAVLAIYMAGQKLIYLNDPQSFWMWHLALLVALAAWSPSWTDLLAIALYTYMNPLTLGFPVPVSGPVGERRSQWQKATLTFQMISAYPDLAPVSRSRSTAPFEALFQSVPDRSRVLFEMSGRDRTYSGYRAFLQLCEELLPARAIDLQADEYARVSDPAFFGEVLARFRSGTPPERLAQIASMVGASYGLAFSPSFVRELERAGFERVAVLRAADVPGQTRAALALPEHDLVLLRAPGPSSTIIPPVVAVHSRRGLCWHAQAGQVYRVHYAYYPEFEAYQAHRALTVRPVPVTAEANLRFIEVSAEVDGPLELVYRKTLI